LVSNKGYGIFWDNPSIGKFTSTATATSYSSECGEMVDYYFFYGPTIDQVIAGYRTTTGPAPLFPKWAYGLFQSKDHYASQSQILAVKDGYRNAKIPVDVIVQDWDYWDETPNGTGNSWGSHLFWKDSYPDPAKLMSDFHAANIHGMISIWPEYQHKSNAPDPTDQDNYNALNGINALLANNGSDFHFYDTMNPAARTLVYQQIYDRIMNKFGWDGIWADNTEPQDYPGGAIPNMHGVTTALGKGALHINAYPLEHVRALYEGWRKVGPNTKRVYVLTRSAWAGTHRYGASVWSGDIDSAFETYAAQIPAGLNIALAGMPYWTTDIGGYVGTPTEESFTRWFQFGAFCSIFRIHGQATKELYSWSTTGKANLLTIDNLHYRLMPYLYSLAWRTTNEGYTIMRHLVFDYQNDSSVFNIKDQFMYGPAFLVNPVTVAGATSRSVYLPAGTWYDFWTGSTKDGGAKVTVDAPLSQIPLFVKAGSIVPMGPNIQYAMQSVDPLEIRIYKGKDASFTLYEDEGDTYNYESGQYSQISFSWSETAQQLTVGARAGSYTGMPASRTFNIVWVAANHGAGVDVTATADQVVTYDGSSVVVSAK
jgi:alpha-D-xyloside xylohydrolase